MTTVLTTLTIVTAMWGLIGVLYVGYALCHLPLYFIKSRN